MLTSQPRYSRAPHVQYSLRYAREILLGGLSVNDIPIVTWSQDRDGTDRFSKDLNRWLKRGENRLSLWTWWPPGRAFAPGAANITIDLAEKIGSGQWTYRPLLIWPGKDYPESYGTTVEKTFETPNAPPTRLWQDAQGLPRTDATKAEALGFATRIHQLFALGGVDPILDIMRYRNAELALVEGTNPHQADQMMRHYLDIVRDRTEFSLAPFDVSRLQVDFIGDDRVLWVRRGGTKAAISFIDRDGEAMMEFSLYLAKIQGRWVWVR